MVPFVTTTEDITVTVRPIYLDHRSDVFEMQFAFGYAIRIENDGEDEVQLLRRFWLIQESTGKVQEVEGQGVIGRQPVIPAGGIHQYNSYCVLDSFEGTMEGYYLMQRPNGERFRAMIPRFNLSAMAN